MPTLKQRQKQRTSNTIEWFSRRLDFSDEQVGELVGVAGKTVGRWRRERSAPKPENFERVNKLERLRRLSEEVFESHEQFQDWLLNPNQELEGEMPLKSLERGEVEPLIEVLATFYAGAFE